MMADFGNGFEVRDDVARIVTSYDRFGVQTGTRPYSAAEITAATDRTTALAAWTNGQALRDKARAALTSNAAFLADSSVTQAEAVTQVQKLTRQVNALIKLAVNDLADQSGT